jgi:hypothetical protein
MRNNWDVNWRKEVSPKATFLVFAPSEAGVVSFDEIVHEVSFGWP